MKKRKEKKRKAVTGSNSKFKFKMEALLAEIREEYDTAFILILPSWDTKGIEKGSLLLKSKSVENSNRFSLKHCQKICLLATAVDESVELEDIKKKKKELVDMSLFSNVLTNKVLVMKLP